MIKILKNMVICGSACFLSCIYYEEFMEIEDSKLRVIGVHYEPFAEVAPGDTLTCKAYFAGDDVISILDREKDSWYSLIELKPPLIVDMEHFKVWLVIYDYTNDLGWPAGYAIKEIKGIFKYTEAYKKSVQ